jgi:hypothetical protein
MPDAPNSNSALVKATVIGTLLQLAMVVAGHYTPTIANQFAGGGMTISHVAGLLYSLWSNPGSAGAAAGGGVVAGAVSAFLGILVSYLLGDVPPSVLGFGTAGSAVAGAVGGMLGKTIVRKTV